MLFSPVSEIASVGRNPPYIISFIAYFIISIILAAVADRSFAGLLILRLLQAFFGSPILASGGASVDDIYSREVVPFFYIPWVLAMYAGPAIGPTLSAYAVPHYWRWPLWEIVIMSAVVLFMLPLLPETSSPNILYQRAARLRATTGKNYRSKAELVKQKPSEIALQAVTIPALIPLKDPAIGFVAVYSAVIYGTYYSFFEAFPIVYPEIYGFSLSGTSLVFWAIVIGSIVGVALYLPYLYFYWIPHIRRNKVEPEAYLRAAFRESPRCQYICLKHTITNPRRSLRLPPPRRPLPLRLDVARIHPLDRAHARHLHLRRHEFRLLSVHHLLPRASVSRLRRVVVRWE